MTYLTTLERRPSYPGFFGQVCPNLPGPCNPNVQSPIATTMGASYLVALGQFLARSSASSTYAPLTFVSLLLCFSTLAINLAGPYRSNAPHILAEFLCWATLWLGSLLWSRVGGRRLSETGSGHIFRLEGDSLAWLILATIAARQIVDINWALVRIPAITSILLAYTFTHKADGAIICSRLSPLFYTSMPKALSTGLFPLAKEAIRSSKAAPSTMGGTCAYSRSLSLPLRSVRPRYSSSPGQPYTPSR